MGCWGGGGVLVLGVGVWVEELVLVSKKIYEPSQLPYLGNCVGLRCVVDPRSPVGDIIDTWVS